MKKKSFGNGKIICREGDPAGHMFFIQEGSAEAFITVNGEKIQVGDFKENSFFGEMSYVLNKPRTATVIAKEKTKGA